MLEQSFPQSHASLPDTSNVGIMEKSQGESDALHCCRYSQISIRSAAFSVWFSSAAPGEPNTA